VPEKSHLKMPARTVFDVQYDSFLDDDNEWDLVMTHAVAYGTPRQMRATFAILPVFKDVGHPVGLFDKHWSAMCGHFVHRSSSEEHPLSDEHLMVLVVIDMRLDARNTNVKSFTYLCPMRKK
jgi:hypothetical protein